MTLKRLRLLLLILTPLSLSGCFILNFAVGIVGLALPIAVAVGGVAFGVWLSKQ